MITFFQEREIGKYLLSKKISGKLLTEIKDHMISQISEIQKNKNLDFENAFEKVKIYWSADLSMVKKNPFSKQKITRIAYEIDKMNNKSILLKSISIAFLFICIEIILAFALNKEWYLNINKIIKIVVFCLLLEIIVMFIRQKSMENKNYGRNMVLNNFIHPMLIFIITIVVDNLIDLPKNSYVLIYDYINFGSQEKITTLIFAESILAGIVFLTLYLFSYFSLKENIRKLETVKNYFS
ncbi:hypothetical protein SAMN05421856_101749 [Chryseobacterium taichungense]|uniref:Uncharacterized protein n=1 Tax=Chryseobacterium taichungense TaxID=295069 RepID=A0A1H7WIP3_9FLAO|nr:hypothetical protein [Chryseobacterium taichungense]SEM20985.1 hypothetical protein SAMN05421856_101749 [Chryseobacterium taichungense]